MTLSRLVVLSALLLALASCSDKTVNKAQDAANSAGEDIENATGTVTARAQAEALRATILQDDNAADVRSIVVLRKSADGLPGEPDVIGIADADQDGRDDDGLVEVQAGNQSACVRLPESGGDIEVESGACSAP